MDDNEENNAQYLKYMGAPFTLVVAPIVGYLLGDWLDKQFETHYLAYCFLVLGLIAGIREFYKLVKSINHDSPD